MIKVLLARRVKRKNCTKLMEHLVDLRTEALHQPGYITGETLVKGYDPVDVLTISSWVSEDYWKAWLTSEKRIELNDIVTPLLEEETKISIYKVSMEND